MAYTYRNKHERSQTVVSEKPLPRLDYLPNWERTEDTEPASTAGGLVEKGPVQVVKGDQHTDVTLLPQARKNADTAQTPARKADSDNGEDTDPYPLPPASAQKPRWVEWWTGHPDDSKRMTEEEASGHTRDQLADLARPTDSDTED